VSGFAERVGDLPDADALIVVPPLSDPRWPALGAHVLRAVAAEAGFRVHVLYASLLWAGDVGREVMAGLAATHRDHLVGERIFGPAAFGRGGHALSDRATELVEAVADAIAAKRYRLVGASTSFDQTAAAIAILDRVAARSPGTTVVIGGANCDGAMARGVRALTERVHAVFSGESERTFVQALRGGALAPIVEGEPCRDLDALPTPDFADWIAQMEAWAPQWKDEAWLVYESSRGCWWGATRHCTFCGLNGTGMAFRTRSPERVISDLKEITSRTGLSHVAMADNIMPHAFHKAVLPRLPAEVPGLRLFYEQKANLTLDQVVGLAEAGVRDIQPGIEALSTGLLRRMRKGVLARQNVALLRSARAAGVNVRWNLLYGLPGDTREEWAEALAVLPKLRHLAPPDGPALLSIDRFSPYFEDPASFGITDVRPWPAYADVLPPGVNPAAVAYHFHGTYRSASLEDPAIHEALGREVQAWQAEWRSGAPALWVTPAGRGWSLVDTRGGRAASWSLTEDQARAVLIGGPLARVPLAAWAIRAGFAVDLDGWCVPLAVAPVDVLRRLATLEPA
jgi:ribosomal peptide maturation radical SAM protein 1